MKTQKHTPYGAEGNHLLRLRDIIAPHGPIPVSRSTWFAWTKAGRVPQAIKCGPRVTAYRRADVEAFLADPEGWKQS